MRPIDYDALREASTLTPEGADHLEFLRQTMDRRDCDPLLPVQIARDVLLCAATNLEGGQPQSQPTTAERLRQVADFLVNLSAIESQHFTEKFMRERPELFGRLFPASDSPAPQESRESDANPGYNDDDRHVGGGR